MRIVGGSFGGRVLRAPSGAATRPTSEKVREAVFQILGDISGAHTLDLFAGSGALGIEALSRGAAHVTFVDSGRQACAAIRANLAALAIENATIVTGDATSFATRERTGATRERTGATRERTGATRERTGATRERTGATHTPMSPWRLVFVDPPYASDLATRAVLALPADRLTRDAVIVIEHDRRNAPPDALGSLLRTDQRRYGDTHISFYEAPP